MQTPVTVFDLFDDFEQWPSTNALEFQQWLADRIAEIPPEHEGTAQIIFDVEEDDTGVVLPRLRMYYYRPETPEETALRTAREAICAAQERERAICAAQERERELALLAKLKAKYEGEGK